MDWLSLGLMGAGTLLGASGKKRQAESDKKRLQFESDIAGINADTARKYAEYEMQAWESVADERENINNLRTEFAINTAQQDATINQSLLEYNAQFSIESINAQSKMTDVSLEIQKRYALDQFDKESVITGIKSGQSKGRARASMAAKGVELDDGSLSDVMDSMDLISSIDRAALQDKATRLKQYFTLQQATNELQTSTKLASVNIDKLSKNTLIQHGIEHKKQQLNLSKDLENFLTRQQLKNEAIRRAWGYQTQATNMDIRRLTSQASANTISPNRELLTGLIEGGTKIYGAKLWEK